MTHKKDNKPLFLLIFLLVMGFSFTSCSKSEWRKSEGMIWHTMYHITYESDRQLEDSVALALDQVGKSLNVFDPNSLVSKVNLSDSVGVDEDFRHVYEKSVEVNRLSDGAFDPTLGPLITAWGFGKRHKATSDTLRLDSLLAITGIAKTRLENGRLIKDNPAIEFNFSAIAKGYGCDRAGEALSRNGSENWLVEIGGEIRCKGNGPTGEGWKVSIDRPVMSDSVMHESQCVVCIKDCGLATSGNYRNFQKDSSGNSYGHTISAKTGRPARTDVLSATVVAPTAMEADALATSMMALGSAGAKELAKKLGYATMLVLSDGSVWENNEFKVLRQD